MNSLNFFLRAVSLLKSLGFYLLCFCLMWGVIACDWPSTKKKDHLFQGYLIEPFETEWVGVSKDQERGLKKDYLKALERHLRPKGLSINPKQGVREKRRFRGHLGWAQKNPEQGSKVLIAFGLSGEDEYGVFHIQIENSYDSTTIDQMAKETARLIDEQLSPVLSSREELRGKLKSKKSEVILLSIKEIQRRGDEHLIPTLRELMLHRDVDISVAAMATLGVLKDEESIELLKGMLTSKEPMKIKQAIFSLGDIGSREAEGILEEIAKRDSKGMMGSYARQMLEAIRRRRKP